jgi:hypothetical protein
VTHTYVFDSQMFLYFLFQIRKHYIYFHLDFFVYILISMCFPTIRQVQPQAFWATNISFTYVLVLFFHIFVVRVHFCRNPHVIDFLLKCGAHWWKLKSANYFETEAVHLYPLTKEELRTNHLICIVPVRNVQRVKMHLQIFDYKLKYKLLENSPVELEI